MKKEKVKEHKQNVFDEIETKELILYNDEVNTFDFVIKALMEICDHDAVQAEQCVYIAHYKGKCPIKSGTFEALNPLYVSMQKRGLTVEIK